MDFSDCAAVPYGTTPLPIPTPSITNPLSDADLLTAWNSNNNIFEISYQGQFPKFCTQVVHDERGKLLFFIIDNNIYNEYGDGCEDPISGDPLFLHDEDPLTAGNEIHRFQGDYLIAPEVTIVPKPSTIEIDCSFDFYVFYAIKYYDNTLGTFHIVHYAKIIRYSNANNITIEGHEIILDEIVLLNQSVKSDWQPNQLSMGISPFNNNNEEYIYVIKGDRYFLFFQIKDDISTIKLDNAKVFYEWYTPISWPVSFPELEIIKNDPSYTMTLATAYGGNSFCVHNIPWEFSLLQGPIYNPGNNMTQILSWWAPGLVYNTFFLSGGWIDYFGTSYPVGNYYRGLEFSENGNYLYLTRDGFPGYQVYDIDNAKNYFSPLGIYDFGNSFIELGKDDKLYLARTTVIPTTSTFSSVEGEICVIDPHNTPDFSTIPYWQQYGRFLDTDQVIQTTNDASGHYGFQGISAANNYFVFPDQVDEFSFSDYYSQQGIHLVFDQLPANLSGSYTWSPGCNGNNPWNSVDGNVYFSESQTIPADVDISLTNMNWHFSDGSSLTLEHGNSYNYGAYLELDKCTLTSGNKCGIEDLWNGVILNGNHSVQDWILTNNQEPVIKLINESRIENAIIGIHSKAGGLIRSTETTYYNNVNAIKFEPFQNTTNNGVYNVINRSSFNKDIFYVDDFMFGYVPTVANNFESHGVHSQNVTLMQRC